MKRGARWYAAGSATAILALLWPGPAASAGTSLGGYSATAHACVVHVELYEPVLPIPGSPQGDLGLGYSRATADTGPSARAIASYLWPGDVLGDGFNQLIGQPNATYPLQVNSRFPATEDSPAKNTIQISDGNGMTTSTDGQATKGAVTLVGLGAGGTSPLGGLGTGLGNLLNAAAGRGATGGKKLPSLPVPLPISLGGLASLQNVTSTSNVTIADTNVTAQAHAAATNVSLLGGLIGLDGVDVTSTVVSDGTKATTTAAAKVAGVTILGHQIGLGDQGLNPGMQSQLPGLGKTLSSVLGTLGITLRTLPVTKTVNGPSGEVTAQVLQITVDTGPLKSQLNAPLSTLIALLGKQAATQLAPIVALAPKIVITVGDLNATATASPAYDGGGTTGRTSGGASAGTSGTTAGISGTTSGTSGPNGDYSGASIGGPSGGLGGPSGGPGGAPTGPVGGVAPLTLQPSALDLPALGSVPRFLILGVLLIAGAFGWVLRNAATLLLGGTGNCDFGLATGVPDLRKGIIR